VAVEATEAPREDEATFVVPLCCALPLPELVRPRPLRLARSWGVTRETNFSAAVVPVRRIVWRTPPETTCAVGIACFAAANR
jgi:hypothetical protein